MASPLKKGCVDRPGACGGWPDALNLPDQAAMLSRGGLPVPIKAKETTTMIRHMLMALGLTILTSVSVARVQTQHPGHRVLAQDNGKITILSPKGEVEWQVPCGYTSHDLA